jgi:hypothetical protein
MSDTVVPIRRLGRLPRAFDQTIPHISSLMMTAVRPPMPPPSVHWTDGLDITDYGMMLNNQLGDCTIAAAYHLMQIWSGHGRGLILTEPDNFVGQAYRELAGYDGTPATDKGAIEQDILHKWLTRGVPIAEGTVENPAPGRSRILFYAEIDKRMRMDVCRSINDCGGVYIGFDVPAWLMETDPLPPVWNVRAENNQIVGGHAVCLTGYDFSSFTFDLISWGKPYKMDFAFFNEYVMEAYAVSHPWFINATGKTPLGKSVDELVNLMHAQSHMVISR